MPYIPNSVSKPLSVVLIVPDARRRHSLAAALAGSQLTIVREYDVYPSRGNLPEIADLTCHVVIVDLDSDVERAMRVIEKICTNNVTVTVMAYSSMNDSTLMHRSMQAGAREFLVEPLPPGAISKAFTRASARCPNQQNAATGKTMAFLPSKGGVGVSTIATNFALTLIKESGAKVVLVDLDFQLGEAALGLGMSAHFSVVDALLNPQRLDKDFLLTLLLKHVSGLSVLAAAEDYGFVHVPAEGATRLFQILRDEFDYVVVDAGTCHSHIQESLLDIADILFLVTEMTFPALRNAHRMISFLSTRDQSRKLEVIVNRFTSRHGGIDEASATKALSRPINWRIPNCYAAARAAQDNGVPLAMGNSPITRALVQIARSVCGKPLNTEKDSSKGFNFFRSRQLTVPAEN